MSKKNPLFEIKLLKPVNSHLGEKSDPLISGAILRIKFKKPLLSWFVGEINNLSDCPLAQMLKMRGFENFSIVEDSALFAIPPSKNLEVKINELSRFFSSLLGKPSF
ncbi:hypothetical protein H5T58_02945 [Candidatus Parcubacteria bacterium]|nr:hypothetical protein [Candidatus Parcubacteria bacterium]